jgi:hypothetical protein
MNCYESEVRLLFSRERPACSRTRCGRHGMRSHDRKDSRPARGIDDFSVRAGTG